MLLVTSSCLLALLVGVVAAPEAWHLAAAPVLIVTAIHLSAGALLFRGVRAALSAAGPVAGEMAVLREGLALLAAQQFQSPKLRALAARVTEAGRTVGDLELWFGVLRERTKDWFLHLSLWMAAGTQTALALDAWRSRHAAALPEWLDAWAEFEALQSLACYAYENQEDCWPEVREGKPRFEASALGHPLLSRARCVANDVRLGEEPAFWVISGSNMAGKSTLLRSVGLACVLSQAGAPVRAARLTLSTLRVHASISILDSLQRGTSRFLAEVERLRDTLQAASHGPVLFLFDEIFSGTNSSDRHIAADAVVGALKERGAIGAVTTHDIALASIARHGGKNVHMASAGGGPLDFDYLVKPRVTPETNAIAIARMAGVPV
ncbi:MAG: hypothetical protein HZB13_14435 [Acidobacteria bacterium]|nr:hypothetical protein [Acidobacteriota bacterium]